jgi:hypothetical protein
MSDAVDRAADELYGLPLGEFVPRRDELARELRGAGDADGAAAVKRMAKPSAPAWAVNQVARQRPDDLAQLLRAGDELRSVQEWLLRGEADPADLRSAVEAERSAVGRLVRGAADLLEAAGRPARGDVLERIGETLHAAAADPAVRADVERGRLVRDRAAVGLGPTVPAGAVRRAGQRSRATAKPKEQPSAAALEELREAEAEARAAERMQAAADKAVERATRTLDDAERNWEAAREELRKAREDLGAAQRSAESARQAAEAAAAEVERRRGG